MKEGLPSSSQASSETLRQSTSNANLNPPPMLAHPPEGEALRVCHVCGEPEVPGLKLKECSGCRNILYCSGKCQKADWPRHRAVCRAGPPADESRLAQYGYTSAAAFSRDIRDYINAHSWASNRLVFIKRQIWRDTHLNTPAVQHPRLIRFRLRCQTTPDSPKNRNPATRFAVVGEPILGDMDQWIREYPHWWEQTQEGRAELMRGYVHKYGSECIGMFAIEFYVPETNSCTMDFLPNLDPLEPDPGSHLRRPLFEDMIQFCMKSMNHGFPLRRSDSNESRAVGIPGRFVQVDKTWKWKPFFNSWDEYSPGERRRKDAAYRELDLAMASCEFWRGPMPQLMKIVSWFCTL